MPENPYDHPKFFEQYSQMSRSLQGLSGAGEWSTLQKLLPDFKGKRVLDLGCGYGWHSMYAAENGAKEVIGIDISEKMLAVAREKTSATNVSYKQESMEEFHANPETFDVVISSLALHYVEDFQQVVQKVYQALTTGGTFIFSVEHPVFTAEGSQDWTRDETGTIVNFPVDNYFFEGRRNVRFLGEEMTKYHRTLTTYLEVLLKNNFTLEHIVEPMPPEDMLDIPGMPDEMRRPMMLIVRARK
ncbi:class I SAM-dependent methyltransferase [Enterococcus saccharolyticus]|uniref:SAM-dependent methyltransferase n=1 Tax=Candidatus Enterococcus willemsii TaxID=1857215 RepID=A0ABQ6YZ36_9ENTE|nr:MULTISPECIES: class I SAM-dependent methyltransferase [Enterococcus]KAF1303610.1 SAM-dependent methyltransferase [Enterococcus sp. CU12B]MCD5001660.1 class I SAM-dependent methyltransferase [Enterococcus saccharolyticus]